MKTSEKISFQKVLSISASMSKPLVLLLNRECQFSLQEEILTAIQEKKEQVFEIVKYNGSLAKALQEELNIENIPALVVLHKSDIKGIFQGLFSSQEINNLLTKIKNQNK